jgi:hypothetical protein
MQIEAKNGILVENAADVSFSDIRLEIENGIPFTGKDSKLINYDRITVQGHASGDPYLVLNNCQSVRISNCFQPETIPLFLKTDEQCDQLYLLNNIMPNTKDLYNKNAKHVRTESNIIQKSKSNI